MKLRIILLRNVRIEDKDAQSQVCNVIMSDKSDSISSISNEVKGKNHTKIKLPNGKKLRFILCSRVNLVKRKCTLQ